LTLPAASCSRRPWFCVRVFCVRTTAMQSEERNEDGANTLSSLSGAGAVVEEIAVDLQSREPSLTSDWSRNDSSISCEAVAFSWSQQLQASILIVEDSADAREMLELLLRARGFKVDSAEDGAMALEMIQAARPDLIVTDIRMPNLDGIG